MDTICNQNPTSTKAGLRVSICGRYDTSANHPSLAVASECEENLLRLIHDGAHQDDLAHLLAIPEAYVQITITKLLKSGVLRQANSSLEPNGFFLEQDDFEMLVYQARGLSQMLADGIIKKWQPIETICTSLSTLSKFTLERAAYIIVGAYTLDLGMLANFYQNATILPPPPKQVTGAYYLWIVEDGNLNRPLYGVGSHSLGQFVLATFGKKRPEERVTLNDRLIGEDTSDKEAQLLLLDCLEAYKQLCLHRTHKLSTNIQRRLKQAGFVNEENQLLVPLLTNNHLQQISHSVRPIAQSLVEICLPRRGSLEKSFRRCRASRYSTFAEFFCWLYHYSFAEALDMLVQGGWLIQPPDEYDSWIEARDLNN